jgi:hypothetical protein
VHQCIEEQESRKREFFRKLEANVANDDASRRDQLVDEFRALIIATEEYRFPGNFLMAGQPAGIGHGGENEARRDAAPGVEPPQTRSSSPGSTSGTCCRPAKFLDVGTPGALL